MSEKRSGAATKGRPCGFPGCERLAYSRPGEGLAGRPYACCPDPRHNAEIAYRARLATKAAAKDAALQRLRALLAGAGLAGSEVNVA
ncbi:MAG: hypothetical protein NVSMB32_05440 [Actinomycetota bacterium]